MATGDKYVNAVTKRFLSSTRLRANVLEYLKKLATDAESRFFPAAGLFSYPVSFTPWAGPPAYFDIKVHPGGGVDIEATDGQGHDLLLEVSRQSNIFFENNPGDRYWVGLHFIEAPDAIQPNPMTGQPEYDKWMEEVGETDNPDSVTDMAGSIRVVVDSIFQNGVDFTGHSVLIWLHNPMSSDDTIAFETLPVQYNAGTGENFIDTTALLGQGTPSTSVGDYGVATFGVTIRNAGPAGANPFSDEYVLLGYVDGNAVAPTWDAGMQIDLSVGGAHSLQKAYDGLSGSGSGRHCTVEDGAIELMATSTGFREDDIANAGLRVDKATNTALHGAGFEEEVGIDLKGRMHQAASILCRVGLADQSGGDFLRMEEDASIAAPGTRITLSRAGADLKFGGGTYQQIISYFDLVEVIGSSLGQDGLYMITAIPVTPATYVDVVELDGSTSPAFVAEAGLKVRFYRAVVAVYGANQGSTVSAPLVIYPMNDFYREYFGGGTVGAYGGIHFRVPTNAHDNDELIKIFATTDIFVFKKSGDFEMIGFLDVGGSAAIGDALAVQNDITSVTGDVIASQDVQASNGDLKAPNGSCSVDNDVTAANGDIEATNGDVIAGVDVVAYDDVTAWADIVASTGDIVSVLGRVRARTDFEYYTKQSFVATIPISSGQSNYDVTSDAPTWFFDPFSALSGTPLWQLNGTFSGYATDKAVMFGFRLPKGAELTGVTAIITKGDAGDMGMKVEKRTPVWTPGSGDYGAAITTIATKSIALWAPPITDALQAVISPAEVIDEDANYWVKFYAGGSDTNIVYVHAVRLEFDILALRP